MRLPDWRIVASGRKTYSNDGRYRVLHIDGTNEWSFQIKYASLEDQGLYECQVPKMNIKMRNQCMLL